VSLHCAEGGEQHDDEEAIHNADILTHRATKGKRLVAALQAMFPVAWLAMLMHHTDDV
jgi:hypothetical protein